MARQGDVDADVVIAGWGPVGGLLAALLGTRGVRTVVVEPSERPYPKPRAAVLDSEAIRVLATLPGMPPLDDWSVPVRRSGAVGPDHRPVFMLEVTAQAYGLPQVVRIDQPALEAGLRDVAAGTGRVEVLGGRSVSGVEQDDDRVVAVLDDGRRVTGRWLVGCDGARGAVREAAGIGFPGDTYRQPWLVVDAATRAGGGPEADGATRAGGRGAGVGGVTDGAAAVAFVLDPDRPAVAMSQAGRWRWEWMLRPGEDPEAMTRPDRVAEFVRPWTDPAGLDVQRAAVFTFHARTAERWRAGRVLLAGDAAHAMPPFAGAGLGMGLRDAVALAWRLVDVTAGRGGSDLLDGYERERRPDVERTTAMAVRIGRVVQTRSRAASGLTRGVLRVLGAAPGLRTRFGDRPRPPRRLPASVAGPLPKAGHVLPNPQVRVAGGAPVRLDEVIGYRWAFIGHGCDPRTAAAADRPDAVLLSLDHPHPAAGCRPIEDLDGLLTGAPGTVTAVRPDRFLRGVLR
jgi:3-(3-hydroxy-phenyl)propionate hydroxylase